MTCPATEPTIDAQRSILPEDVGATLLASANLDYGEYRDGRPLWRALAGDPY